MSIRKSVILFGVALSMAAFMSGCSSDTKESGNPADVQKVGDTKCYQCHAATADPLTGETFIEQYQRSLHAELGCESCHGGGAMHNGIGPLPFDLSSEVPDAKKAARCAQCHDGVTKFTTLNGKEVVARLSSSPNFQSGNHANPFGAEEAHEPKCARCHSHEGSILYGRDGYTGSKTILNNTALQPVLARDPETFNVVKCATCHEHGGNIRQTKTWKVDTNTNTPIEVVTWDPNGNKVIDQFDLCTSCHNVTTNEGKLIGSGNSFGIITTASIGAGTKSVETAPFYHDTAWYRTLPSTHYDFPESKNYKVEGYVIRKNTENPCYDCHGHEFKANTRTYADRPERGRTIYTDWAQSGHAGHILEQKVAAAATAGNRTTAQVDAVMKAGVTSASGDAWIHYDWDNSTGTSNDRKGCQACHTSTGISNYLNDPAGYDPAKNSFSHLAGKNPAFAWGINPATGRESDAFKESPQNELLYCWGCHSNSGTGKLRATGSATLTFKINNQPVVISNVGNSASCIVCHGGRGSVGELTADDSRSTRFQGHHAPTAGIMFAAQTHTAFEYAGQNYTNAAFKHDEINAATSGPCASCHMASKNHTFHSVSSAGGTVQKIYAQSLCNTCHGSMATATLDDGRNGYAQASTILNNYVANRTGFTNYLGGAISSATVAVGATPPANHYTTIEDNAYGAFQNAKLNGEEPCAYVHNPTYTKRVIFDSIDWMDNGKLDGTITINATTFPKAAAWFGASAGGAATRP